MNKAQLDQLEAGIFDYNLSWQLRGSFIMGYAAAYFKPALDKFWEKHPTVDVTFLSNIIYITGVRREVALDFMKAFGGKWKKSADDFHAGSLSYEQTFQFPIADLAMKVAAYNVAPPPSCRVEEQIVEIPARTEKVIRVCCSSNTDPEEKDVVAETEGLMIQA